MENQTSSHRPHRLEEDLRQWYQKRGARNVVVQMFDDAHMAERQAAVEQHILHPHSSEFKATDLEDMAREVEQARGGRWSAELRKFYLRHFVYHLSTITDNRYDWYVFGREDNYFVTPLDLHDIGKRLEQQEENNNNNNNSSMLDPPLDNKTLPLVAVDDACRFGSYSDKMYVANAPGADLLFGRTWVDYVNQMKQYVMWMAYRWIHIKPNSVRKYQPEAFVHDRLSTARVITVDMQRVDLRYVAKESGPHRCIPPTYYKCLSATTRKRSAEEHGLDACDF